MRTRREIKERAKELLGRGIFTNAWLYMLLSVLVGSLLLSATSSLIIGIILAGVFMIGIRRVTLSVARGEDQQADIMKVFSGFTDGRVGDNIVLGLLIALFECLWSLLFIIPGIVKHYAYAMSYFIKIDHPEMSAIDCITESRKMMKGHKWRLFVFDLSFIGWYIVGFLCLGVGALWVDAYYQTALAEFYRALNNEQN